MEQIFSYQSNSEQLIKLKVTYFPHISKNSGESASIESNMAQKTIEEDYTKYKSLLMYLKDIEHK